MNRYTFEVSGHLKVSAEVSVCAKDEDEARDNLDWESPLLHAEPSTWPEVDDIVLIAVERDEPEAA